MLRATVWRWWVAAGVLATAGYHLLPADSFAANAIYNALGLLSAALILVGVRLHRPRHRAVWYLFAAGQATATVGDLIWQYYLYVLEQEPFPSVADAFYLAFYPLLAVGLWLLARSRRDGAGIADAAMAGISLGLVFWIFVLHPIAADSSASTLERVISTAYPAGDALLLAMLARLLTSRAGTASARLLGVATVLLLIADTGYSVVTLYSDSTGDQFAAGWLMSYVLWAAAALHPSVAQEPAAGPRSVRVGRVQLGMLIVGALLSPAMLFIPAAGNDLVDRFAIGASSAVLILLVAARVVGLMREVRGQSAELERIASHDDLTGLPNRRRLDQVLAGAGRPRIVFLGLSGLKNINDELGRTVGDEVVVLLAHRIRAAAPPAAFVARLGGDEFAVLLPPAADTDPHTHTADTAHTHAAGTHATDTDTAGTDATDTDAVVRRIAAALTAPVEAGGHQLLVGAGIGVAEAADAVEVLRRAEMAMHAAKDTGEPYRHWSADLDERAGEHARLGAEMRAALATGQFQVVYQPIVEMPTARVAAVEALVRWQHPTRGMVSPAHFIPVAEQNGQIVELGAWILRTACTRMAHWRATLGPGAPDRVSVNVSARQLARPEFPAVVAAALAAAALPPQCLTIEVTETAVFGGGQAVQTLHELRALGVRIALDDFGTGHSSLGLLHTIPVDVLKVDKSFVDRVTEAGRHAVIASALIQVSEGLGLVAVAEGVETAEQAEALCALGYRLLQGYHFGRPVAEPAFGVAVPA